MTFNEWWKDYDLREARKWDDYESIARDAWDAALANREKCSCSCHEPITRRGKAEGPYLCMECCDGR